MANRIEIDNLTEVELSDLNHRIVERLRFLHQARAHSRMLEFSVGDKVAFKPDGYETLFGVLTRYNKKDRYGHNGARSAVECRACQSAEN